VGALAALAAAGAVLVWAGHGERTGSVATSGSSRSAATA